MSGVLTFALDNGVGVRNAKQHWQEQLWPLLSVSLQIDNLNSFQGERDKLANVDKFYLSLLAVPW